MVLVLDKKPFEKSWWKFGLGLSAAQMVLWCLFGFRVIPAFDLLHELQSGYFAYVSFIIFAFLPFAAARLGLKRLYWCSLAGYILADAAYFLLAAYEPVRRLNPVLPAIGFVQLAMMLFMVGLVVEFGRYVYKKVVEE
jgi:hypothetical protein